MPIISIAIQKGGSGKTTTAINLSAAFQQMGRSVLLIDLDPQANGTQALGFTDDFDVSIYSLLRTEAAGQPVNASEAIKRVGDLSLIPSSLDLANAEMELAGVYGRERLLENILTPLGKLYDFIIIDCPPSMGILTVNALVASDYVVMPLQAEFLPLKGVESFMRHMEHIKKKLNPKIDLLGFVLTQYDSRKNMSRTILDALDAAYPDKVFKKTIRRNIAIVEAQQQGVDIFTYDKTAHGAMDYISLGAEVLYRISFMS
jgi:chromosome partitioning protein